MDQSLKNIRKSVLWMTHYSGSSHVGSCLSIIDILYVLYFRLMNIDPQEPEKTNRDTFILSKAHGSAALYATLAERGYFSKDYLDKFYTDNGILPGHLDKLAVPGLETSGGSLGHGLSLGVGIALANKYDNINSKIYVLLGDGELNEGSVWEAIMFAGSKKLHNLVAIIDYNKLQSFGATNEVINQQNMSSRWESFGWDTYEVDGHNIVELERILSIENNRPKVIIAHTIKGKGVSFMENKLEWHYKSPTFDEYTKAIHELDEML